MGRRPLDIDTIVSDLVLSDDMAKKKVLAKKILDIGYKQGVYPLSIHQLYVAMGKGEVNGFTVPAFN
ncbi:MAG: hypothetical protein PHE58_02415 [Candidatus Omnitrophica bacterium]|nr:hypothetical protein [Candidatus Omnitrophota bacterium]